MKPFWSATGSAVQGPGKDSRIDVTVTQGSFYVRDSYDFNGFQPLGFWRRSPKSVSVSLKGPGAFFGRFCPENWAEIENSTFREFRTKKQMGRDFIVYSKLMTVTLEKPVKIHAVGDGKPWFD
ncbi:DUF6402 family protein [Streptomyces sp. NPDC000941]